MKRIMGTGEPALKSAGLVRRPCDIVAVFALELDVFSGTRFSSAMRASLWVVSLRSAPFSNA
jgi:hypothetical protein